MILDKSHNLSKIVSVLLSASVERFFVSRMRDFLLASQSKKIYPESGMDLASELIVKEHPLLLSKFYLVRKVTKESSNRANSSDVELQLKHCTGFATS